MVITTSPLVKTYTLQEFWDLPEPADRSKLELIKGVLYMTPPPGHPHNQAAADLIQQLVNALTRSGCRGQIFVPRAAIWVDDDTYLEPDLMYISDELKSQMDPKHWTRADIVIEILSPKTEVYARTTKSDTYRAMGVREMWLVDVEGKQIEVRNFEKGRTAVFKAAQGLRSDILPGIEIPLTALFPTE
jgi:Uma2 family endonuclease